MNALLVASLALTHLPGLPEGIKFDDGFTWVECQTFERQQGETVVGEWVPNVSVRLWGKTPDRSGFKFVLKKGDKKVSEYATDGYTVKLAGQDVGMNIVGFWKDAQRTMESGPMTMDVVYIDGATNQEHLAKTLKLDVHKVARTRAAVGSREPYANTFFVNRHGEMLSNYVYFREYELPSYTMWPGLTWYSERRVELVFNYSDNENFASPAQGRLVVEVNGKPIEMKVPGEDFIKDEMGFGDSAGKFNVEHSDRDSEKVFKSGPFYRERIGFQRRSMLLPLQWGPAVPGRPQSQVSTNDHPGDWKVTWLIDRKPVRIFRFKVGPNGAPLPHPEQAAGLFLIPNAALVDTEIPGEGGEFDGRIAPAFAKQGFFGRPWATAEMKAAAEKLPKKGRPFPVSSKELGGLLENRK